MMSRSWPPARTIDPSADVCPEVHHRSEGVMDVRHGVNRAQPTGAALSVKSSGSIAPFLCAEPGRGPTPCQRRDGPEAWIGQRIRSGLRAPEARDQG